MLNSSNLKSLAKLGTAMSIMIAASACSHEQLKEEAQVSAIEETSLDSPTPDILVPTTPVPSDENQGLTAAPVARKHHAKKISKKKSAHHAAKSHAKKISKRRKHQKTMVAAAAGRVDSNLPPAPPIDDAAIQQDALTIPAPPVTDEAALAAAPEAASSEEGLGLPLTIVLGLGVLGALTVAGLKLRKGRGSRRLVFT